MSCVCALTGSGFSRAQGSSWRKNKQAVPVAHGAKSLGWVKSRRARPLVACVGALARAATAGTAAVSPPRPGPTATAAARTVATAPTAAATPSRPKRHNDRRKRRRHAGVADTATPVLTGWWPVHDVGGHWSARRGAPISPGADEHVTTSLRLYPVASWGYTVLHPSGPDDQGRQGQTSVRAAAGVRGQRTQCDWHGLARPRQIWRYIGMRTRCINNHVGHRSSYRAWRGVGGCPYTWWRTTFPAGGGEAPPHGGNARPHGGDGRGGSPPDGRSAHCCPISQ